MPEQALQEKAVQNVCPKCGAALTLRMSYCPKCGARILQPGDSPQDADPYLGTVIDNIFKVESILGKGNMGVVYKAVRLNMTDKRVAIKVLRHDYLSNRVILARFQREAQAASQLNHPNVVHIEHYGRTFLNAPYIAMECLEGDELSAIILKQFPLNQRRVCSIVMQVARALVAAHAAGIIHRDLKPANIIVVPTPEGEVAKVLDFGIAKISDSAGEALTREGAICGTPAFMSPEQVLGRAVTPISDVFSLGSVMYFMLTNKLPFSGTTMVEMATSILNTTPTPPSNVRIDTYVDPQLDRICMKALQKEGAERYQSAQEMVRDLEAVFPQIPLINPSGRHRIVIQDPDADSASAMDDSEATCCEVPAYLESEDFDSVNNVDDEGATCVGVSAFDIPDDEADGTASMPCHASSQGNPAVRPPSLPNSRNALNSANSSRFVNSANSPNSMMSSVSIIPPALSFPQSNEPFAPPAPFKPKSPSPQNGMPRSGEHHEATRISLAIGDASITPKQHNKRRMMLVIIAAVLLSVCAAAAVIVSIQSSSSKKREAADAAIEAVRAEREQEEAAEEQQKMRELVLLCGRISQNIHSSAGLGAAYGLAEKEHAETDSSANKNSKSASDKEKTPASQKKAASPKKSPSVSTKTASTKTASTKTASTKTASTKTASTQKTKSSNDNLKQAIELESSRSKDKNCEAFRALQKDRSLSEKDRSTVLARVTKWCKRVEI